MLRDSTGIIIQEGDDLDKSGGDSAFSTGIMAFSGSLDDLFLMPKFIIDGKLVRHPYQEMWNKPELTSRDQVMAFFAGPTKSSQVSSACLSYAQGWFVNNDILAPADKYYLYLCSGANAPFWLKPIAYFNQFLNLLWDCFIKPEDEKNQRILMNVAFGPWWIKTMYKWHPNLEKNVIDYFSGWRKKEAIGNLFFNRILKEINE